MPTNYQEPIEQKDLDLEKKFRETKADESGDMSPEAESGKEKPEAVPGKEVLVEAEKEAGVSEKREEKVAEKIETARKTIGVQPSPAGTNVASDARAVSQVADYEKKVEKLVELALQKGPEHAIKVARHLDKGKGSSEMDNYTLDEIHDRLIEEGLRKQLMQKGLLKEL